jgi:hypothetical protein
VFFVEMIQRGVLHPPFIAIFLPDKSKSIFLICSFEDLTVTFD